MGVGFELRASHLQSRCFPAWATPPVHFALISMEMEVSWTICLGWPRPEILLISASQVAKIIGMSCWYPTLSLYIYIFFAQKCFRKVQLYFGHIFIHTPDISHLLNK
jgi:hypothetical protein